MKISNEDRDNKKYVVISYDHNNEDVANELKLYDEEGVCYWHDIQMQIGDNYEESFYNALDHENCKGIIFFISNRFFLSGPCANEMNHFDIKYFKTKKNGDNPDKFALFIVSKDFCFDEDTIFNNAMEYAKDNPVKAFSEMSERQKNVALAKRIETFWKISEGGKQLYGVINSADSYIEKACSKGGLFYKSGVLTEHIVKEIKIEKFGYFPQLETDEFNLDNKFGHVPRPLDMMPAYFSPIEWIVLKADSNKKVIMSKLLLFTMNYLDLKYPLATSYETSSGNNNVMNALNKKFMKHYKINSESEEAEYVIQNIRFLTSDELDKLLRFSADEEEELMILTPESSFYAKTNANPVSLDFWLAGDVENAYRVDVRTQGLSTLEIGTETHFVRVVLELSKKTE